MQNSEISFSSEEVLNMHRHQHTSFYWNLKKQCLSHIFNRFLSKGTVLDIGCGTCFLVKDFKFRPGQYTGIDALPKAIEIANLNMANAERQLHLGEINILTEKKNRKKFDSCLLLDVLEHIEDDRDFIKEIKKILKNNGQLVLSVPAHQFLFSPADEKSGHFRRYNYRDLEKKLEDCGFEIIWCSSFTILLLPLLVFSRLYSRYKKQYNIDSEHSSFINRILCTFIPIESILFRTGFFKFGASIFLVAKATSTIRP